MISPQKKAAKKAARTRAMNRAELKYHEEVVRPAAIRLNTIMNWLVRQQLAPISVHWNPTRAHGRKLRKGAEYGTLLGFQHGYFLKVLVEGYKRPQVFHPADWEFLVEEKTA